MKPRAFGIHETSLKFPHWQRPVLEALRNKDCAGKNRLKEMISAAQTAIFTRQKRMSAHKRHDAERRAMEDAMVVLCILERSYLASPDGDSSAKAAPFDFQPRPQSKDIGPTP